MPRPIPPPSPPGLSPTTRSSHVYVLVFVFHSRLVFMSSDIRSVGWRESSWITSQTLSHSIGLKRLGRETGCLEDSFQSRLESYLTFSDVPSLYLLGHLNDGSTFDFGVKLWIPIKTQEKADVSHCLWASKSKAVAELRLFFFLKVIGFF